MNSIEPFNLTQFGARSFQRLREITSTRSCEMLSLPVSLSHCMPPIMLCHNYGSGGSRSSGWFGCWFARSGGSRAVKHCHSLIPICFWHCNPYKWVTPLQFPRLVPEHETMETGDSIGDQGVARPRSWICKMNLCRSQSWLREEPSLQIFSNVGLVKTWQGNDEPSTVDTSGSSENEQKLVCTRIYELDKMFVEVTLHQLPWASDYWGGGGGGVLTFSEVHQRRRLLHC